MYLIFDKERKQTSFSFGQLVSNHKDKIYFECTSEVAIQKLKESTRYVFYDFNKDVQSKCFEFLKWAFIFFGLLYEISFLKFSFIFICQYFRA